MGFEYFYGFVAATRASGSRTVSQHDGDLPVRGQAGWNLTTAMADEAIEHMTDLKAVAPDKPFFVYYVPGGTDAPHHPTPDGIKKIGDMKLFDGGWNKLRETIFAQKRLGSVPAKLNRGRRNCRMGFAAFEEKNSSPDRWTS